MRRITARRGGKPDENGASYRIVGRQISFDLIMTVAPIDAGTSRLGIDCTLTAHSIGMRLLLEPMRLVRANAQGRFEAGAMLLARHLAALDGAV